MIAKTKTLIPEITGKILTRVDRDGIPTIVQSMRFDPLASVYKVFYFDGTYTILTVPVQVNILGVTPQPSQQDWERIEREATDKYVNMVDIKSSLCRTPTHWGTLCE